MPIVPIYTNENYNSGNGMLTTIWGPPQWHLLHTISFNYPVRPTKSQKRHYKEYILSLQHVLPCGKCRENLKRNLAVLPLTEKELESRDTFSLYIYNLHELVNTMLKKKSNLTYQQVKDKYEDFRAKCAPPKSDRRHHHATRTTPRGGDNNTRRSSSSSVVSSTATTTKTRRKKETGCVKPLNGKKSKCVLTFIYG